MVSLEEVLSDEEIRILAESGVASELHPRLFNVRKELKRKNSGEIQLQDKEGNTYNAQDLITVNYFNKVYTKSVFVTKSPPNSKVYQEILGFYAESKDPANYYLIIGEINNKNIMAFISNLFRMPISNPDFKKAADISKVSSELKENDVFTTIALFDTVLRTSKYLGINNIDISYLKGSKNKKFLEIAEKALKVLSGFYNVNII
ncbi:MAG: hypothetical protein QXJ93_01840 [Candidatus Rehaiarchaeum fermentans]|nr:hypothetical protein [Candidatus Rehaiarchaeum fermentans]